VKKRGVEMKKAVLLFFAAFLAGCSYAGEKKLDAYLIDPRTWVKDPHFAHYKEQRDTLESEYLQKNISYAEYLERRTGLDEQYAREVSGRNAIISSVD
jgi:hypothetical protein